MHIKNTACPRCREQGNDRAGDNLAVYADGSCYCWKCGYWNNDNLSARGILDCRSIDVFKTLPVITLPSDADIAYSDKAVQWLGPYEITRQDMLSNGVLYSEQGIKLKVGQADNLLIFPYWVDNQLVGWQGRYFGNNKAIPKWISRGGLNTLYYIFLNGRRVGHERHKTSALVLVEDVVSALKVSKAGINTMPLFGVNVKSRINQIRLLNYQEAFLFLDPDMHTQMIKECNTARCSGFKMHPVVADKDPKYYSVEEIKKWLKRESYN